MQFFTSAAAFATFLSLTSARIVGIAVPATIRPGDGFNAIIETQDYIQSVYDVSIAFGVNPGAGYPGSLGNVLGTYYLGPEQSNTISNITKWINLVPTVANGPAVISASLFSLWGASASGSLTNFVVNVTIGDATSSEYLSSHA